MSPSWRPRRLSISPHSARFPWVKGDRWACSVADSHRHSDQVQFLHSVEHQVGADRRPGEFRVAEAPAVYCRLGPHPGHCRARIHRATWRPGSPAARLDSVRRRPAARYSPARRRAPRAPGPRRRRAPARPMRWGVGKHAYATPFARGDPVAAGIGRPGCLRELRVPVKSSTGTEAYTCSGSTLLVESLPRSGASYARKACRS
jgi:hypothetical protein